MLSFVGFCRFVPSLLKVGLLQSVMAEEEPGVYKPNFGEGETHCFDTFEMVRFWLQLILSPPR